MEAVFRGEADAAAIDSNVPSIRLRETPALRRKLRVIESWGPHPIQPAVVNSDLHPNLKGRLRAAFFAINENERMRRVLQRCGLSRFVAVDHETYDFDAYQNLATLLTSPTT